MKKIVWDAAKDQWLRARRGISFDEIKRAIDAGNLLAIRDNPSPRHAGQSILIVRLKGYVWAVPFRESETTLFLITAFPSRKLKHEFAQASKTAETDET